MSDGCSEGKLTMGGWITIGIGVALTGAWMLAIGSAVLKLIELL